MTNNAATKPIPNHMCKSAGWKKLLQKFVWACMQSWVKLVGLFRMFYPVSGSAGISKSKQKCKLHLTCNIKSKMDDVWKIENFFGSRWHPYQNNQAVSWLGVEPHATSHDTSSQPIDHWSLYPANKNYCSSSLCKFRWRILYYCWWSEVKWTWRMVCMCSRCRGSVWWRCAEWCMNVLSVSTLILRLKLSVFRIFHSTALNSLPSPRFVKSIYRQPISVSSITIDFLSLPFHCSCITTISLIRVYYFYIGGILLSQFQFLHVFINQSISMVFVRHHSTKH